MLPDILAASGESAKTFSCPYVLARAPKHRASMF